MDYLDILLLPLVVWAALQEEEGDRYYKSVKVLEPSNGLRRSDITTTYTYC